MLACIIIEDQPPAQRILKKYISNADNLILKGTFSNPLEAKNYLLKEKIDLIFLDIHLPKMSGLEFLKSEENHPKVILTTAYSEYALESYQYNVIDYLLKPFSYDRFLKSIQKVNNLDNKSQFFNKNNSNILYIKTGYEVLKIDSNEIYYIKSDGDYTEIFMETKKILTSDSLKNWLEKLKSNFCQVHKSYIINEHHFNKLLKNQLYLNNDIVIPLGRAYKKTFIEKNLSQKNIH
jgi:DNA-binding LytR/AlgR family response regulator